MNVLKIVVDELPEYCALCIFSEASTISGKFGYCKANGRRPVKNVKKIPNWCPLVVDVPEVCEWSIVTDTIYEPFYKCSNCGFELDKEKLETGDWDIHQTLYCPNCGKRIKYVEREE